MKWFRFALALPGFVLVTYALSQFLIVTQVDAAMSGCYAENFYFLGAVSLLSGLAELSVAAFLTLRPFAAQKFLRFIGVGIGLAAAFILSVNFALKMFDRDSFCEVRNVVINSVLSNFCVDVQCDHRTL